MELELPDEISATRSKKPVRVTTVMTRDETRMVISALKGTHKLMDEVMYGCGLRVIECVRLRVNDIDFTRSGFKAFIQVQGQGGDGDSSTGIHRVF